MMRDPEKSRLVLRGFPRKRRMTPTTPPTMRVKTRAVHEWMKEFTRTRILPRIVACARVSSRYRRVGSPSWTPSHRLGLPRHAFVLELESFRGRVGVRTRSASRKLHLVAREVRIGLQDGLGATFLRAFAHGELSVPAAQKEADATSRRASRFVEFVFIYTGGS